MSVPFVPIKFGELAPQLWEVGLAQEVERSALQRHLGKPLYVETDASCTFGGEEDWWAFKSASGTTIAVCLRVPYRDAVLCASSASGLSIPEARSLLKPWAVELFSEPRLR